MNHLRVALDWTPNTNHTGFFVAQSLGYYSEAGLEVHLLTPESDNYTLTPAKKLALGQADFALAPFESVISLNTKANPMQAVAVAALLREDISAIVALTSSHINRPSDLDGLIYASYKARYEDAIVKQMIVNDGGRGDLRITYPDKLGIWHTLLTNAADSTWIFDNWEGVEADTQGIQLTRFRLADYGIPYGYSPVLLTTRHQIDNNTEVYKRFLNATKKGFLYAVGNVAESAAMLAQFVPQRDKERIDLLKSQAYTSAYYGDETNWGKLESGRVNAFLDWLKTQGLETTDLDANTLFTNALIE
ncbi:ABC transporter substrate-binding protein [Fibrella sp. HMF5335]|uniref:Thiamine pyrimidine synthase n=1 Tax=Fibrella rubiginis TaxID=2817060 RepID=A0A939GEH2_9BACT|nr:ABC transporter substrate-binding protein [Fibrella rubiginis]MBO0936005.1 ABC transporter substrate-binding protein [Fibrella rubiginis]